MAMRKARTPVALPTSLVERATNVAKRRRRTVETIVASALERYLDEPPPQRRPPAKARSKQPGGDLSELFAMVRESCRDIPAEEWDKLPRDGAHNHDRYIYGRP